MNHDLGSDIAPQGSTGARNPANPSWPPPDAKVPSSAEASQWMQWLPPGWVVLGRCRHGTAEPGPLANGCHAIAHPAVGAALIDIAPDATPNAEARLRRALGTSEFWPDFPGTLPVWHGRIEGADCRDLETLLRTQFAVLPPLTVAGGPAWVRAMREALAADPAWEVPGQGARPAPPAETEPAPRRRRSLAARGRRGALVLAGVLLTFVVGVLTGFALLPAPAPTVHAPTDRSVPTRQAAGPALPPRASLDQPMPAAPLRAAAITAPAALTAETTAGESGRAAMSAAAAPIAASPSAMVSAPAAAPATEASIRPQEQATPVAASRLDRPDPPVATLPAAALADPSSAAGSPLAASLPDPPPVSPVPPPLPAAQAVASRPVRVAATQPSGIDRACSRAVFRYQQGAVLTAVEAAHVRNGCATRR